MGNVSAVNISEKHERKGDTKLCAYGLCKSDSRYMDRPGMEGVFFIRFPQFHREPEKCTRWANSSKIMLILKQLKPLPQCYIIILFM